LLHDAVLPRSYARLCLRAFSSEVETGSRQENASNKNLEPRSDSIGTEKALGWSTFNLTEIKIAGHPPKRLPAMLSK
jgi:hypothetical protein